MCVCDIFLYTHTALSEKVVLMPETLWQTKPVPGFGCLFMSHGTCRPEWKLSGSAAELNQAYLQWRWCHFTLDDLSKYIHSSLMQSCRSCRSTHFTQICTSASALRIGNTVFCAIYTDLANFRRTFLFCFVLLELQEWAGLSSPRPRVSTWLQISKY